MIFLYNIIIYFIYGTNILIYMLSKIKLQKGVNKMMNLKWEFTKIIKAINMKMFNINN